jgi:tRNA threonylcarbamoyladenosine biosynthesis protein TsaB
MNPGVVLIMKILAFDTSTKYLSIACLKDDTVISKLHEQMGIRHSEKLLVKMRDVMDNVKWKIRDIDLICVGIGPGSFTGLRIAVATCKGLAAAIGTNVLGVPSIDAIALRSSGNDLKAAPVLDARKGKIYSAVYERTGKNIRRISDYLLVTADDFVNGLDEKVRVYGDGVGVYSDIFEGSALVEVCPDMDWYPRAVDIGILGYNIYRKRNFADDPAKLDPMYLHSRDCNVNKKS